MAKVQLTPEEIAAKKIRRSNGWTRFWAIVVALVLVVGASGFVANKAKTARTEAEEALKEQQEAIQRFRRRQHGGWRRQRCGSNG